MGSDSYRDLPRWHEPLRLFEHANLLVGKRPNSSYDEQALWATLPPARTRTEFVDIPLIEISSTRFANGFLITCRSTTWFPGVFRTTSKRLDSISMQSSHRTGGRYSIDPPEADPLILRRSGPCHDRGLYFGRAQTPLSQ